MGKKYGNNEPGGTSVAFLICILIILLVVQCTASVVLPRSLTLTAITDSVEILLMGLATFSFLENASSSRGSVRLFWTLFAISWATIAFIQVGWAYYDVILRREAPNPFAGDVLLFLSNIPMLAALLLQTQPQGWNKQKRSGFVDFALLLVWWLYLYLYFVTPWQFVEFNEARYGSAYNRVNALGDIVVLLLAAYLVKYASGGWRKLYAVFLAAKVLMSVSGFLMNQAIDTHAYYAGSWYEVPYAASLAMFTIVALVGRSLKEDISDVQAASPFPLRRWGMFSLLSLPVITAVAALTQQVSLPVAHFREVVVQGSILVMGVLIFMRQRRLMFELAESARVLQHASVTDSLTGCRNRRFLDISLPVDANQALRSHQTTPNERSRDLVFYLIDLDNFKEVNDRHGHAMGDRVLVEVANRIKSVIRKSDVLVRWGGDEFLILSRNSDRGEAPNFCQRILGVIEAPIPSGSTEHPTIRQTCSVGWAAFPWRHDRPEEMESEAVLALADRALYHAKMSGKNQGVGISPSGTNTAVLEATLAHEKTSSSTSPQQLPLEIDLYTMFVNG